MAKIVKDDGSWFPDPSGARDGDLQAWRDNMHLKCPNPAVGDIVIVLNQAQRKKIGYRALNSAGYHTRWQRVSAEEIDKHIRIIDPKEGRNELVELEDFVYLADGVYVHKDDSWF